MVANITNTCQVLSLLYLQFSPLSPRSGLEYRCLNYCDSPFPAKLPPAHWNGTFQQHFRSHLSPAFLLSEFLHWFPTAFRRSLSCIQGPSQIHPKLPHCIPRLLCSNPMSCSPHSLNCPYCPTSLSPCTWFYWPVRSHLPS